MVRAAPALRHHVVDGEFAEWEHHPAAHAQPLLLAEQDVLVLSVWDRRVDVGALRDVFATLVALFFDCLLEAIFTSYSGGHSLRPLELVRRGGEPEYLGDLVRGVLGLLGDAEQDVSCLIRNGHETEAFDAQVY